MTDHKHETHQEVWSTPTTVWAGQSYTPRNKSQRQSNCEGGICNQPARPEPYQVFGVPRWLCDDCAHFELSRLLHGATMETRPEIMVELSHIRRRKALTGWSEATGHDPDFEYITASLPMPIRSIHDLGSTILGGK